MRTIEIGGSLLTDTVRDFSLKADTLIDDNISISTPASHFRSAVPKDEKSRRPGRGAALGIASPPAAAQLALPQRLVARLDDWLEKILQDTLLPRYDVD